MSLSSVFLCRSTVPPLVVLVLVVTLWAVPATATVGTPTPDPACEATGGGRCFYIEPNAGSGSGTFEDPFGVDDLPDPDVAWCGLDSPALEALHPGDVLYFRQGAYQLATCPPPNVWSIPYLRPARSGTAEAPITLRSYPGERVELVRASGGQPTIGDDSWDFIRILGFVIGPKVPLRVSGDDGEIAFNEIVGEFVATSDNHDGMRIEGSNRIWIHHNIVRGVDGHHVNSAGIKLYRVTDALIEDNWIYDNRAGVFDKDSGVRNTYRRNWFGGNHAAEFYGNNQGLDSTIYFYENVVDGVIELHHLMDGSEVHDNLVRGVNSLTGAWAGEVWNSYVWNNVVLATEGTEITAYYERQHEFVDSGPRPHLQYVDFNVYNLPPKYDFGEYTANRTIFTLADIRALGFELDAQIVTGADEIYVDQQSYVLLTPWLTAGRYGDPIGPDDVATILDASRYGPESCPSAIFADGFESGNTSAWSTAP
ncbi:MAG: right-handed parallel beta-helix repeat-containing protein [Thermoanaerobaculia bacterium]|nr:right-handed parallel beta-helix repeat-containing protein [Thermoanaerobaculia bacterium]